MNAIVVIIMIFMCHLACYKNTMLALLNYMLHNHNIYMEKSYNIYASHFLDFTCTSNVKTNFAQNQMSCRCHKLYNAVFCHLRSTHKTEFSKWYLFIDDSMFEIISRFLKILFTWNSTHTTQLFTIILQNLRFTLCDLNIRYHE